jgi:hypothetical protein
VPAKLLDMGNKKPKPDGAAPKVGMIRVDGDISDDLAIVAAIFKKSVQEIISPHLRPIVKKLRAEARRLLDEREQEAKS